MVETSGDDPIDNRWRPGSRVGEFVLERPLGAGGKAAVYLARGPGGLQAAIKVLHPHSLKTEDARRFTRELDTLHRLEHPHIVGVYGSGELDGYPWIALEYVDGLALDELLESWRTTPPPNRFERVEYITRKLCEALAYVHETGLVHRDLKPSNVLMTSEGEPKLSDFGVVKDSAQAGTQLTVAGRLVGTVAFMAPEQITGEVVDPRTDLYALGAVMYNLLTFRRPIEADSVAGYLARHLTEIPTPPTHIDPEVPLHLERVCLRLLMKDREHRFPNANEVLAALDNRGAVRLPLRGRDELTATVRAQILNLHAAGAGGVTAVLGPTGSGRTAMLEEVVETARSHGVRIVKGSSARPLPSLAEALGLPVGTTATSERWVERLGGEPLVVILDDLDASTDLELADLEMLMSALLAKGCAVRFLFSAEGLGEPLDSIGGGGLSEPPELLELEPLERREVLAMLRDRGISGSLVPKLGKRLHRESEGWPGPIVDQLDALVAAGWLYAEGNQLRLGRTNSEFVMGELPVPASVQRQTLERMKGLSRDARELATFVALFDRAVALGVVQRCSRADLRSAWPEALDSGLLRMVDAEERLWFQHPASARVIRAALGEESRRRGHATVARALTNRRRRSKNSEEVAIHLERAGDFKKAYPSYIEAARSASRRNAYGEVIALTDAASRLRGEAEAHLDGAEVIRLRCRLMQTRGEALLARGDWRGAMKALRSAVEAARQSEDRSVLGRCLGSLGRALYRQGQFDQAVEPLREALQFCEPGGPERGPSVRALADLSLRNGSFEEAETLWREALQVAVANSERDGEARARRGLAHLRALQVRLDEAAVLLDEAEELLYPEGDQRVRCSTMARSIELDLAAGRLAAAQHRSASLVAALRSGGHSERMPEAFALSARAACLLGRREEAEAHLQQCQTFLSAASTNQWSARLLSTRLWLDLEALDEAEASLPADTDLPHMPIDEPAVQLAALRARIFARQRQRSARDLATWCLVRTPPMMVIRTADILVDVSDALRCLGDTAQARSAAKKAIRLASESGTDGIALQGLLALYRAQPEERVLRAIARVSARIVAGLPRDLAADFRNRKSIAEALSLL